MESSSLACKRRSTTGALSLIPCPFCGARMLTFVCGARESKPVERYYKCSRKDESRRRDSVRADPAPSAISCSSSSCTSCGFMLNPLRLI